MVITRVKQPPENSWSIVTQQPIMRPFDTMGFTLAETRLEIEESERLHQMTLNFNLSASPLDLSGITGPEALTGADAEQWAKLDENKLRVMAFLSIPDDSAPPVPCPEGDSDYFRVRIIEGDTNSNMLPDWWELANNFNPYGFGDDAVDANSDADGDGYTNYEEYLAGSNPHALEQNRLHIPDSFSWLQSDLTDYRQIANEGDSPYPLFRFRYLKYWADPSLDSRLSGQAVGIGVFANDPINTFGWPSGWSNNQDLALNYTGLRRGRPDDFKLGGKFFRPTGSGTFDVGMTQNASVRLYTYLKSPFSLTRRYLAVSHIRTYDYARDFIPSETFKETRRNS